MDTKYNVANLSVLKTVSDSIKSNIQRWETINPTWTETTTYPTGDFADYTIATSSTYSGSISIFKAEFSVQAGDEFILTGSLTYTSTYIAWFTSTSPFTYHQLYSYPEYVYDDSYIQKSKIIIPFNGTLKLYDYRSENNTKFTRIEKRIR